MRNNTVITGETNFYVSPRGNDVNGDGCALRPFQTIKRAQESVRKALHKRPESSVTVHVHPGKYELETPLIFTEEDSPSGDGRVLYIADKKYSTDAVELTGSITLEPKQWEPYPEHPGMMVTQLSPGLKIDLLFVNGQEQILARYPDYQLDCIPLGGAASADEIRQRVSGYQDPAGGYIRALHNYKWGGNSYIITGKDESDPLGLSYHWVGDNNRGSAMDLESIVIENVFEELDAPGEWFYNNKTGKLYYYPPAGIDLENAVLEGAVSSELIKVIGRGINDLAGNIVFDGFTLRGTSRTMFTVAEDGKEYIPLLRGDWCVVRAGAVYIENAENVTLQNMEFRDFGGNGIFISGYNQGHCIDNNEFIHAGASCIQIVGSPEAVYEPSFWEHDLYKEDSKHVVHKTKVEEPEHIGPRSEDYPREIVISRNHMSDIGVYEKQSAGINLSICRHIKILSNTIHRSARSCINVNDGTFGGHEIAYNDIFDSQRETTDHGPFNSWGRDRFWSVPEYNAQGMYGELARPYARIDAVDTVEIHDNRFHHAADQPHTWGIDLDDGSTNYNIHHNLGLGVGVKLREGFDRKVHHNIFVNGQIQVHCTYRQANDQIYHNLIINRVPWGFAGQSTGDRTGILEGGVRVEGNWYYNFNDEIVLPEFFVELELDKDAVINADPLFKDPQNNDYRIMNTLYQGKSGIQICEPEKYGKPGCNDKSPSYFLESAITETDELRESIWMGAVITDIDEAIISSTATKGTDGIYFKEVPTDSDAAAMGFQKMDIIKQMDKQQIESVDQFLQLMQEWEPGITKKAGIIRRTAYTNIFISII